MNLLSICIDNNIQMAPIIGALIAAGVAMWGWNEISKKNRKHELDKEWRGYRLELLRSFIKLRGDMEKEDYKFKKEVFYEPAIKIEIFGKEEEKIAFKKIKIELEKLETLQSEICTEYEGWSKEKKKKNLQERNEILEEIIKLKDKATHELIDLIELLRSSIRNELKE